MQYMLIHTGDEGLERTAHQAAEDQAQLQAWIEEVVRLRVDLHGSRLRPTSDATTVRVRDGQLSVTDGPFAETKEQVGGYDVIECRDAEEALRWASKHPTARLGAIEVRPFRYAPPPAPLPAPAPGKTRYLMFVCLGEDFEMSPEEAAQMSPLTEGWVKEFDARGNRIFGGQLENVDQARTVRCRDGEVLVSDGPFAESKEMIAGLDVLDCSDLDEAIEVTAKHPMARFGMLELRPFWAVGEE